MSNPFVLAGIVVAASIAAWVLFMAYVSMPSRRQELATPLPEKVLVGVGAEGAEGMVEPAPPPRRQKEEAEGVTRRQFINRAYVGALFVGLANFSLASLDFLWPRVRGGFGAKITVNIQGLEDVQAIRNRLAGTRIPEFISDGRFYLAVYEGDAAAADEIPAYKAANVAATNLMAIYRKCVHLGCSVPWCSPAKWFECPCHGSKYSINGEYRDGPAPRGLDRFRVEIVGGKIVVDTSTIIVGPPRGTVSSQPQPEGEHCVEVREG